MVMEREQKEGTHGHATATHLEPELGAAVRTRTGTRPRPATVCARALCGAAEDRRRGDGACRCAPRPVEAARCRHGLRLAGSLCGRRTRRPERPPAWWLPPEPAATTRRGPPA